MNTNRKYTTIIALVVIGKFQQCDCEIILLVFLVCNGILILIEGIPVLHFDIIWRLYGPGHAFLLILRKISDLSH